MKKDNILLNTSFENSKEYYNTLNELISNIRSNADGILNNLVSENDSLQQVRFKIHNEISSDFDRLVKLLSKNLNSYEHEELFANLSQIENESDFWKAIIEFVRIKSTREEELKFLTEKSIEEQFRILSDIFKNYFIVRKLPDENIDLSSELISIIFNLFEYSSTSMIFNNRNGDAFVEDVQDYCELKSEIIQYVGSLIQMNKELIKDQLFFKRLNRIDFKLDDITEKLNELLLKLS